MKSGGKIILAIAIALVFIVAMYFTLFFYYAPENISEFKGYQEKCAKAKFISQAEDVDWEYKIQGRDNDRCQIDVTAIKVKEGTLDKQILEGKTMSCYMVLGSTNNPESDISDCHGELKEEMQTLIINNLHKYIADNLEQIAGALNQSSI
jgi:hypothetical protein